MLISSNEHTRPSGPAPPPRVLLLHHSVFHALIVMGTLCRDVLTIKIGLVLNTFAM